MNTTTQPIERNWVKGNGLLGVESRLKTKEVLQQEKVQPSDEALIATMIEFKKSVDAKDNLYMSRELQNGKIEISAAGVYLTLTKKMFDSIMDLITDYGNR